MSKNSGTNLAANLAANKSQFLFGAATAAHQVEGNNHNNDWWQFETTTPGVHQSGAAANSYELYKEDRKILQQMGCNTYRFSIEWARIEPTQGNFDLDALNHYRELILDLRAHGITPIVTLHHFTNPIWLEAIGAWENPKVVEYFSRYVNYVCNALKNVVDYWVTVNEPNVYLASKYILKIWFPAIFSPLKAYKVAKHFLAAHRASYKLIKAHSTTAQVSLCINAIRFVPIHNHYYLLNLLVCGVLHWLNNRLAFVLLRNYTDFIGLNFYTRAKLSLDPYAKEWFRTDPPMLNLNNNVFSQFPRDLTWLLNLFKNSGRPIIITENGINTDDDNLRVKYLQSIFRILKQAVSAKINIIGYMHWSLIDNFEWHFGYRPKFGLYSVEPDTFKRLPKPSSLKYAELINAWEPTEG